MAKRARAALREAGRPDRARLVVTSPPYLRVVKYGYYNWLRTWFLGFDARAIDAGPIARVRLPERISSGTHSYWMARSGDEG